MKITKRKAYRDLYEIGLYTKDDSNLSGYKHDRSKPSPKGDKLIVPKGEYYYTWSVYGDKKPRISLTYPDKKQLTKSYYKLAVYDLESKISGLLPGEEFAEQIKDFQIFLNELILKIDTRKSNIPHQLQDNKAGSMLDTRLNLLLSFQSKVEDIISEYNLKGVGASRVVIDKLNDLLSEDPLFRSV